MRRVCGCATDRNDHEHPWTISSVVLGLTPAPLLWVAVYLVAAAGISLGVRVILRVLLNR